MFRPQIREAEDLWSSWPMVVLWCWCALSGAPSPHIYTKSAIFQHAQDASMGRCGQRDDSPTLTSQTYISPPSVGNPWKQFSPETPHQCVHWEVPTGTPFFSQTQPFCSPLTTALEPVQKRPSEGKRLVDSTCGLISLCERPLWCPQTPCYVQETRPKVVSPHHPPRIIQVHRAPLTSLPRRCWQCFTPGHPLDSEIWRVLTTTTTSDVWTREKGGGALDTDCQLLESNCRPPVH